MKSILSNNQVPYGNFFPNQHSRKQSSQKTPTIIYFMIIISYFFVDKFDNLFFGINLPFYSDVSFRRTLPESYIIKLDNMLLSFPWMKEQSYNKNDQWLIYHNLSQKKYFTVDFRAYVLWKNTRNFIIYSTQRENDLKGNKRAYKSLDNFLMKYI